MSMGSPTVPHADSPYFERVSAASHRIWKSGAPLLSSLDVELTERCQNNCRHCYINLPADDVGARTRELSTRALLQVIEEAAHLGALSVRLTGGEPLLRKDFAEIYVATRRLGLKVQLYTNGRLITPELADLFARMPPLQKIAITVYGMRQESYEAVTKAPGSFSEFQRGVALLVERSVPVQLMSTVVPANRADLEAFETWARALSGDRESPAITVLLHQRGRRDSPIRNREINSLRLPPEEIVNIYTRRSPAYAERMSEFCTKFMRPPGDLLFGCGAGQSVCLDAYGSLQACMLLRHPDTVYDLAGRSLREALATHFSDMRDLRAQNPNYLDRCARCFLMGLCEQCPAKSWMEHGTLDTPVEYLCQVAHAQGRALGLLADGERSWEVTDWKARVACMTT